MLRSMLRASPFVLLLAAQLAAPALAQPFAYVADNSGNAVHVIDTATDRVVDTIPGLGFPRGVTIHPSGAFAYVANRETNTVAVIDTATNTVVAQPIVKQPAGGLAANPNGTEVYVPRLTG